MCLEQLLLLHAWSYYVNLLLAWLYAYIIKNVQKYALLIGFVASDSIIVPSEYV